MNDTQAKVILDQANQLYDAAEQELYKPEEDVVNYVVFRNAFQSVLKYLRGYLLDHGLEASPGSSLGELHNRCCAINATFFDLNLKPLFEGIDDKNVWMNPEIVREAIKTATQVRSIVTRETP